MDKSAAEAFVYAKASGVLGKSFINERAAALFNVKTLSELWTLLFKIPVPVVPEVLLAEEIEKQAFKEFITQYTYFVSQYENPPAVLLDQLCVYDADNLKNIASSLCSGAEKCPSLINLDNFSKLHPECWPDLEKITAESDFSWYNKVPEIHQQQANEFKVDLQVVRKIWNSISHLHGDEYDSLLNLFKTEYEIKNIVWALRLKLNYQMKNEDIIKNLIYVTEDCSKDDPVAGSAISVLEKEPDNYENWKNWKYSELLNPHVSGEVWKVDPSWIEKKNRLKINKQAMLVFHQLSLSPFSLIGWYKIKEFEVSCIRTAVESIRLGIAESEAMGAIGIE